MKAYIMVDFEGCTGMIEWDDAISDSPHVFEKRQRLRKILSGEVNAAIEGVLAAGVDEVLVWDSHGPAYNCNNLYIEDLHPEAWVIQGSKGLPEFFPQLDDSFDMGLYIGGHAMEGTPHAVLPHTVTDVNGIKLGEVGAFAAMCGWYNVPMVFVSGDKATIGEVRQLIPNVHHVVTKEAFGPYAAKTRVPAKSRELIRKETETAASIAKKFSPYRISPPFRVGTGDEAVKGDDFRKTHHQWLGQWTQFGDQDVQPERDRIRAKREEWAKEDSFLG